MHNPGMTVGTDCVAQHTDSAEVLMLSTVVISTGNKHSRHLLLNNCAAKISCNTCGDPKSTMTNSHMLFTKTYI